MRKLLLAAGILVLIFSCGNDKKPEQQAELSEQDQRMEWWREARFGLFIHWGLYAQPAGEWKGEEIPGISEWIMLRAQIPVAEYEQLTTTFNPVKYDADQWVQLAKQAGNSRTVNTVLLGALSNTLEPTHEQWIAAIKSLVPERFLDVNLKAFELGRQVR